MADFLLGRLKFVWQGNWATGTAYVKDDIVYKDGTAWVCLTPHTANANFYTDRDSTYWNTMAAGLNWTGSWSSSTTYQVNSLASYSGNVYISTLADNLNNTPTSGTGWSTFAAGSLDDVLTTKGDVAYRGTSTTTRLPIGTNGQVLTVGAGGIPGWENPNVAGSVYYVSTSGSDSNNGTSISRAFKTLRYACSTVTGPATIYVKTGTYYEQFPITVPANVSIIGDSMRDTIIAPLTGTASTTYVPTGSSGTTLKVVSTNGIYPGMSVQGTGFTNALSNAQTVVAVVDSATLTLSGAPNTTPSGTLTFTYYSTDASPVVNNLSTMFYLSDSVMLQQLLMTGMTGFTYNGSYPTDITQATIGGVYIRLNPATTITIKSPYIKDCTAKSAGGVGAIIDGTAQSGGITSMVFWAYNMVLDNGVGIYALNGGKVEAVSCFTYYAYMGYATASGGQIRSLSGNNSYGTYGVVSEGYLTSETPVTGTVYGNMLTLSTPTLVGTFQQGEIISQPATTSLANTASSQSGTTVTLTYATQGSAPYAVGQKILVAGITLTGAYPTAANGTWTVTSCTTTQVVFTVVQSATASGTGSPGTITAIATAYITSVQTGYLYYKQQYGTFNTVNTVTGATSGATVLATSDGGQNNYLLVLSSLSAAPAVGASIQFTSGDTSAYVIQATSTATINSVGVTIITLAQQKATPSTDGTGVQVRYNFSLIRLQGHDFLYIGTGGVSSTNYPNVNIGSANPANQIIYTFPGRVYYVATDQAGNFNVGAYFSVNQATGSATLNASAFNLSGLTSLRLGSIGAQLGAQVNEFSTDGTMSQNSAVKVPTQSAVRTYLGASYQNFAPATDLGYDLGTPSKRWGHVYVGPGSITLGTLTITDSSGTLQVQSSGANAPLNINSINNGTSNVTVAQNGNVTITSGGSTAITSTSTQTTISGNLVVNGNVTYGGTITETTTTILNVADPLIYLAQNNNANANDIGIVGHFTASPTGYQHTGLVRHAVDNTWYLFSGATTEPSTVITTTDGTFTIDTLKANINANIVKFLPTTTSATSVAFKAPTSVASNIVWTLPNADASTAGFALVSDGGGNLSWAAAGAVIATDTTDTVLYPTMTTLTTGNFTAAKVNTNFVFNGSVPNLQIVGNTTNDSLTFKSATSNYSSLGFGVNTGTGYTYIQSAAAGSGTVQPLQVYVGGTSYLTVNTSGISVTGTVTSTTGFVESSSITLKENVNPITNALDAITSLVGVIYDRKDGSKKNEPGLIAEEVNKVIPNLVSKDEDGNAEGIYYSKLTAYLVEAIKDLKSQIDPLKEEIRKLKGE